MTPSQIQFQSWCRLNGFYTDVVEAYPSGKKEVFIDFRDVKGKRDEKRIAAQAKKCGLKISITDKGACFG